MTCFYCKRESLEKKPNEKKIAIAKTLLVCDNCKVQYCIGANGHTHIVKYPRWYISIVLPFVLLFSLVPLWLILRLILPVENEALMGILRIVFLLYFNAIPISLIIGSFQDVYHFIAKGFMFHFTMGRVLTKDDGRAYIERFCGNLIFGLILAIGTILTNIALVSDFFGS